MNPLPAILTSLTIFLLSWTPAAAQAVPGEESSSSRRDGETAVETPDLKGGENFVLTLNGQELPMALGESYEITLTREVEVEIEVDTPATGDTETGDDTSPPSPAEETAAPEKKTITQSVTIPLKLELVRRDNSRYRGELFQFEHPPALQPVTTRLDETISQTVIHTPSGGGIIIQEYFSVAPDAFAEAILEEALATQRAKAGAGGSPALEIVRQPFEAKLPSGQTMKGQRARATLLEPEQESIARFEVASLSWQSGGVLVLTMRLDENEQAAKTLVDLFWKTLKIDPQTD